MDLQLANKVVLITGGAKGIGAAIARAAGQEGAIPVIVDRDAAACESLQAELRESGAKSHSLSLELSSPENCKSAVEQTVARLGRLDALVNNAGVNDGVGLERGSP